MSRILALFYFINMTIAYLGFDVINILDKLKCQNQNEAS